jgi:membrane associated rhomboid family serine protease
MLLPLSDAPNPRGVPVVTYLLIAVNVLVYALVTVPLGLQQADLSDPRLGDYLETFRRSLPPGLSLREVVSQISQYDLFVFAHGYKPASPQISDLFVSLFLHGGFMHLLGNMLFLWIYGDNVEHRLGRVPFLFWYLATGVAATLAFAMFAGDSMVPLVGASGAISGVLGFYFLWFPRNTVRVFVFLFPFFMNVINVPARIVLGIFLILDNLLPFLMSGGSGGGGVAYGAHLGGFVAGLLAARIVTPREARVSADSLGDQGQPGGVAQPLTAIPQTVGDRLNGGDMAGAARAYFTLTPDKTQGLLTPEQSLRLADWLAANHHTDAALAVLRRQLRDDPAGPLAARAHAGAGLIQLRQLGQVVPAYQHFLEALDLDPDAETAAIAREALAQIASLQKYQLGRRGAGPRPS